MNILINYLSTVNFRKENHYAKYDSSGEKEYHYSGYQTNEPVTGYWMHQCGKKTKRPDQIHIISVCSKKVSGENVFIDDDHCEYGEAIGKTHYEYYQSRVEKEFRKWFSSGAQVLFKKLDISDVPEDTEIQNMVVQLAEKVKELRSKEPPKNCHILLDYTGGDRLAATMLVALSRLLEEKGYTEIRLYGVNFYEINDEDNPCQIREKQEVSRMFDLISGMREFMDYGNAKQLLKYFKNRINNAEEEVLELINNISNQVQINRPDGIRNSIGEFADKSKEYIKKFEEKTSGTTFNSLFAYMLQEIRDDYGDLMNKGELTPKKICEWALKKGLIQQAVTIYCDLIPRGFVEQKILYYNDDDWNKGDKLPVNWGKNKKIKWYKNDFQNILRYDPFGKQKTIDDIKKDITENDPGRIDENDEVTFIYKYVGKEYKENDYVLLGEEICIDCLNRNLKNYNSFRKEVRNKISHVSKKFEAGYIIKNLELSNKKTYEGDEVTAEMVKKLLEELIEDLGTLGMK